MSASQRRSIGSPVPGSSGRADATAPCEPNRHEADMTILSLDLVNETNAAFVRAKDIPSAGPRNVGLLLTNLGTPDWTDYWSVRRYLAGSLSDRRVSDAHRLLWRSILNARILTALLLR